MAGLVIISIWLVGVIGWVLNGVQIVHTLDMPITGLFILKCIGIFVAPLGSVLGWVGLF